MKTVPIGGLGLEQGLVQGLVSLFHPLTLRLTSISLSSREGELNRQRHQHVVELPWLPSITPSHLCPATADIPDLAGMMSQASCTECRNSHLAPCL